MAAVSGRTNQFGRLAWWPPVKKCTTHPPPGGGDYYNAIHNALQAKGKCHNPECPLWKLKKTSTKFDRGAPKGEGVPLGHLQRQKKPVKSVVNVLRRRQVLYPV